MTGLEPHQHWQCRLRPGLVLSDPDEDYGVEVICEVGAWEIMEVTMGNPGKMEVSRKKSGKIIQEMEVAHIKNPQTFLKWRF